MCLRSRWEGVIFMWEGVIYMTIVILLVFGFVAAMMIALASAPSDKPGSRQGWRRSADRRNWR